MSMESIAKFDLFQFISAFEKSQMSNCSVKCFDETGKYSIVEFEKNSWETLVFVFDEHTPAYETSNNYRYRISSSLEVIKNSEFNELQEFAETNLKTYCRDFYKFVKTFDVLKTVIHNTEEIFGNGSRLFNEFGLFSQDPFCSSFKMVEAFGLIIKSYSYMKPTGDVKWGNYLHEILPDNKFTAMYNKPTIKLEFNRGDLSEKIVYGLQEFSLNRDEIKAFQKGYYDEKELLCVNFDDIPTMRGLPFEKRSKISYDFKNYLPKRNMNESFILSKHHWSIDNHY